MDNEFGLTPFAAMAARDAADVAACNDLTARFGLTLGGAQIQRLIKSRFEALRDMGRVEMGEGVLKKLIFAFCDSPFMEQDTYEQTLAGLQETFYYFKNESMEALGDDELIAIMRLRFDNECEGSLEYLQETALEDICRDVRYGYGVCGKD